MTNTAVMARGPPFVYAGQNRGTADGHDAIVEIFRQGIAKILFDTGHLHRRGESAAGEERPSFGLGASSCEIFHQSQTRRQIPVTKPPKPGDALPAVCFEVEDTAAH